MIKFIAMLFMMALPACSHVSYKRGDIEVTGWEFGTDKALSGLSYSSDIVNLKIDSLDQNQTNGMAQVNQFVQMIVEGAVKGAKP